MNVRRVVTKLKNFLPRFLMGAYVIFFGVMVYSGFTDLARAWGFREDGLFVLLIGIPSMLIVIFALWGLKAQVEVRGLSDVLSKGIGRKQVLKNNKKNNSENSA